MTPAVAIVLVVDGEIAAVPYPFKPTIRIRSHAQGAWWVKIIVYDLLGREVRVLVNEWRVAGKYTDVFDGSGLANGVYTFRLTTASTVQSRSMLLVK